ncbi:MAG: class I SAM-dependent methyltransferase [Verrucomicrobiota bacterium]
MNEFPEEYLKRVEAVFPELAKRARSEATIDNPSVNAYFNQSRKAYRLFNSMAGSIHLKLAPQGASPDARGSHETQVRFVSDRVNQFLKDGDCVLELGCGNGFNSLFLANLYPTLSFTATDLNSESIDRVRKKTEGLSNLDCFENDYHELEDFDESSFGVIFAVETLCYSQRLGLLSRQTRRVLKPGGRLIIFDGYRGEASNPGENLGYVQRLVENSMAVTRFPTAAELIEAFNANGLELVNNENCSDRVTHDLKKFSLLARAFFKSQKVAKLLKHSLGAELCGNAVAGLLMPFTFKAGLHEYRCLEFEAY